MLIDKVDLRQAIRELARAKLTNEEKLRRIDLFLSGIKETDWDEVFSIMKEEDLRLGVFTLKDLLVLFVRFKDYRGLHQLKNRMYVITNNMPSLFDVKWRKIPLGTRERNGRTFRPADINDWPISNFYDVIYHFVRMGAIKYKDFHGTTIVEKDSHFSSAACGTIEKLLAYPNVRKYLYRQINRIVQENNRNVDKEVSFLKAETRTSYGPLSIGLPLELVQTLGSRLGFSYRAIEQSLNVVVSCSMSEEEGKPVKMGIILEGIKKVGQLFAAQSVAPFTHGLFLNENDWPKIREEISRTADGTVAALIVDGKTGRLKDVRILPRHFDGDFYCYLTHPMQSDGIGLLVKQSSVRVYCNGTLKYQLILNRKLGRWVTRDIGAIFNEVEQRSIGNSVKSGLISLIGNVATKMSEDKEGAIAIVGDLRSIEPYLLEESKERISAARRRLIQDMSEEEIIQLLREDGAVIFDKEGQFRGSHIKFNGPGGRHAIARYITEKCHGSLSVVVSQDATITVYEKGHIIKEF